MPIRDFIWKNGKFELVDSDTLDGVHDEQYQDGFAALSKLKADDFSYRNGIFQLSSEGIPIGKQVVIDNASSGGVNVFITGYTIVSFTAATPTTSFSIENYVQGTAVEITMEEGLSLMSGEHYIISADGIVTLFFELEVGQTVFCTLIKTSYNYNDLLNAPKIINDINVGGTENVLNAEAIKNFKKEITDTLNTKISQAFMQADEFCQVVFNINGSVLETFFIDGVLLRTVLTEYPSERAITITTTEKGDITTEHTFFNEDGTIEITKAKGAIL